MTPPLLVALVVTVYHSVTWFNVTPQAMPVQIGEEFVPGQYIVGAHYGTRDWLNFIEQFYRGNSQHRGLEDAARQAEAEAEYPLIDIGTDPESGEPIRVRIGRFGAFLQLGYRAVRFNFRGVGGSAGGWDAGRGEIDQFGFDSEQLEWRWMVNEIAGDDQYLRLKFLDLTTQRSPQGHIEMLPKMHIRDMDHLE